MPNTVTQTKFILKRGEEPKQSTEEFWAKFTYQIIGTVKKKPDKLTEVEGTTGISDEDALNVEICTGAFLDALGDEALAEIQLQSPKAKIYDQKLKWLKEKWEACYKPNKNLTEKLLKLWSTNRDKNVDLFQHWLSLLASLARCNLDDTGKAD